MQVTLMNDNPDSARVRQRNTGAASQANDNGLSRSTVPA
jgi:hypothetical protein